MKSIITIAFLIGCLSFGVELSGIRNSEQAVVKDGEFLLDTNMVYVFAQENQTRPSSAFGDTNYLVVWTDERYGGRSDIYCTRVNQAGEVVDSAGIIISTGSCPSVAFDGTNWLVVWHKNNNIYGARVAQSGEVLDPEGIAITTGGFEDAYPSVAFDGKNYLVVWQRNGVSIYGTRVTQSGKVLDIEGIVISAPGVLKMLPSVAFNGTNYLVVWEYKPNILAPFYIYGARVEPSGTVLDSYGIAISVTVADNRNPSVASDETNWLVVWEDERAFPPPIDIYGARVDPSGTVLDPNGIRISPPLGAYWWSLDPLVAFDGTNYLVAWYQHCGNLIFGTRVNQSGMVLDPTGILITTEGYSHDRPTVAFGKANYLVAWNTTRLKWSYDIFGARVDQSGTVIDPLGILISTAPYQQDWSSVAFDGTNWLVVWRDWRSGIDPEIYGARVNQVGAVLDPFGIAISSLATNANVGGDPSVASDGTNYLVVWTGKRSTYEEENIYGTRVGQSGTVIDLAGIPISTAPRDQWFPAVAFGETSYLVVWQDWRGFNDLDIYGTRVDQSGVVLDHPWAGIGISTTADQQFRPSVAFDGTNWLVVWTDNRNGNYDIYGTFVTQSGIVLDSDGIAISTAMLHQYTPSVAFDGTNYLVVWVDSRSGIENIYGTRVTQSGEVLDPDGITISIGTEWKQGTSVAFDGTNWLVIWQESHMLHIQDDAHIYGAYVNQSGEVIDTFAVSGATGIQLLPALARGADDRFLITYSGWVSEINDRPANTIRIWGRFYPGIGVEEVTKLVSNSSELVVCPNPFSKEAHIAFSISSSASSAELHLAKNQIQNAGYSLMIYDLTGRLVKTFPLISTKIGTVSWDGEDDSGNKLSSGVYFCKLRLGDKNLTKRLVLLR